MMHADLTLQNAACRIRDLQASAPRSNHERPQYPDAERKPRLPWAPLPQRRTNR